MLEDAPGAFSAQWSLHVSPNAVLETYSILFVTICAKASHFSKQCQLLENCSVDYHCVLHSPITPQSIVFTATQVTLAQ